MATNDPRFTPSDLKGLSAIPPSPLLPRELTPSPIPSWPAPGDKPLDYLFSTVPYFLPGAAGSAVGTSVGMATLLKILADSMTPRAALQGRPEDPDDSSRAIIVGPGRNQVLGIGQPKEPGRTYYAQKSLPFIQELERSPHEYYVESVRPEKLGEHSLGETWIDDPGVRGKGKIRSYLDVKGAREALGSPERAWLHELLHGWFATKAPESLKKHYMRFRGMPSASLTPIQNQAFDAITHELTGPRPKAIPIDPKAYGGAIPAYEKAVETMRLNPDIYPPGTGTDIGQIRQHALLDKIADVLYRRAQEQEARQTAQELEYKQLLEQKKRPPVSTGSRFRMR